MKLIRFGAKGTERPGLWKDGRIVDLRRHFPDMPDIGETFLREGWMAKIAAAASVADDPGEEMDIRLGPPLHRTSKIICVGKNYGAHAKEGGFDAPEKPILFNKLPSTLNGPTDPILLPVSAGKIDWEVELAVIIGKEIKRISRDQAFDAVAGYSVINDVSGREAQFGDGQWFRGKSFDTFAPLGPCLVTPDEIEDITNLYPRSWVNGEPMQEGCTDEMIFDIPFLIEYISRDITLIPGDIIATGTPAGVGIFRDPPITLSDGDVVACRIDPIGELANPCVAG